MRLAPLILTLLVAGPPALAQVPIQLPWRITGGGAPPSPPPAPRFTTPLQVLIREDGSVHVYNSKGLRLWRMGLPGRPQRLWRDGGHPIQGPKAPLGFPEQTLLTQGMGAWPLTAPDFRPTLEGLLWVLDDGERCLTVLHPATCQALSFLLPEVENLQIQFHPDRLEVWGRDEGGPTRGLHWAVAWKSLLPHFLKLAQPAPRPPKGTALNPFPQQGP